MARLFRCFSDTNSVAKKLSGCILVRSRLDQGRLGHVRAHLYLYIKRTLLNYVYLIRDSGEIEASFIFNQNIQYSILPARMCACSIM